MTPIRRAIAIAALAVIVVAIIGFITFDSNAKRRLTAWRIRQIAQKVERSPDNKGRIAEIAELRAGRL